MLYKYEYAMREVFIMIIVIVKLARVAVLDVWYF
jgi:hypothetical protein